MNKPITLTPRVVEKVGIDVIDIAPENPRSNETIDAVAIANLADNIATIGILTPLIAYPDGKKLMVTAGGRRLRAVRELDNDGRWDDPVVPVQIMDKEDAINAGNAEQLTHQIMSDLDTLKVFAMPQYKGMSDELLAKMTGRTEKYVRQRRAILDLPQEALDYLFEGRLTVSQCAGLVYWIDSDQFDEQVHDCLDNPRVTGDGLRRRYERRFRAWSESNIAEFVGKEAYENAGGKLQGDLFAEDQFILDPDILMECAERTAADMLGKETCRAVLVTSDLPSGWKKHPGVNQLTEEEQDRWDEIYWDFECDDENDEKEIRAEIAGLFDDEQKEMTKQFDEWLDLSKKAKPEYPDDLAEHLYTSFSIVEWGEPLRVNRHVEPWDEAEREPLYEKGYLKRPEPAAEPAEGETPMEEETAISAALADRIKKIKAHCARQDMIKRPDQVLEEYLVNIAVPTYYASHFSYRPDWNSQLSDTDPEPIFSAAWDKASQMDDSKEETLRALKPAEQRKVLARRVLECLNKDYSAMDVTAQMLRDYIKLDAQFFKAYKKAGLIQMLDAYGKEPPQGWKSMKLGDLAEATATLFKENKTWLPTGF